MNRDSARRVDSSSSRRGSTGATSFSARVHVLRVALLLAASTACAGSHAGSIPPDVEHPWHPTCDEACMNECASTELDPEACTRRCDEACRPATEDDARCGDRRGVLVVDLDGAPEHGSNHEIPAEVLEAKRILLGFREHDEASLAEARATLYAFESPVRDEERGEIDGRPYLHAREVHSSVGLTLHLDGDRIVNVESTTPASPDECETRDETGR